MISLRPEQRLHHQDNADSAGVLAAGRFFILRSRPSHLTRCGHRGHRGLAPATCSAANHRRASTAASRSTTRIPRTKSGKIVELAVRDVVHGRPVRNTEALANPEALEHFRDREELRS
jgi:hypothetical protein